MPSGASIAERAVGLPWLRPSPAALAALTGDPPAVAGVVADPAAVSHILRYCRPTSTPQCHPFTSAGLLQPALLGTAADLLEHVEPTTPPPPVLAEFVHTLTAVAGNLAAADGLDPQLAAAVAVLVPLGWLAVTAVEPLSCAEVRFRLATSTSQKDAWGLDAVAIGRRLAARWRLPDWVTATVGLIRLRPDDAIRAGAPENLFPIIQRAVAAVEADRLRLGLTDQAAARGDDIAVSRACRSEPDDIEPVPAWAEVRLLRAVAAARRGSGAVWQADAETRADRLADSLASLRAEWESELRTAKLSGLAEFAAGASHEINNPLGVISGHAQMLLNKETDPGRRKQLAAIVRQTERVHDLLRGTLQFARPPAAKPGVGRVGVLLQACADDHAVEAAGKGATLTVEADAVAVVAGDPEQIRRAVSQLVRNALDAVPPFGTVRLTAEPAGDRVLVRVSDSGPGPAAAAVPHLFDPFFSGKSAGRGRGLGLSIAWRLVRQNGGDLRFDPTPAEPSRFTLSLLMPAANRRSA